MPYWRMPDEAFDDPDEAARWIAVADEAARRVALAEKHRSDLRPWPQNAGTTARCARTASRGQVGSGREVRGIGR